MTLGFKQNTNAKTTVQRMQAFNMVNLSPYWFHSETGKLLKVIGRESD
jgi:hypothetical protein